MKIVFVIPTLTSGGSERVISTMANFWAEKGHSISIIALDEDQNKPFYPLDENIRYIPLNLFIKPKNYIKKLFVTLQQIRTIRKCISSLKPAVVISFLDITNLLTINATFFLNVKVIVSERSNLRMSTINPILKNLNKKIFYRFADKIIVQTSSVKDLYSKSLQEKIEVIPNPVREPEDFYKATADNFRNKKIINVGRLEYVKGQDNLIKAFTKLHKKYPDWSLIIVGEGGERENLQNIINKYEVSQSVQLVGRLDNIYSILSESSILAQTSRFEGFPNALCEAMACGLPVISTNCNFGPNEIIKDNVNGKLVPVDDVDALTLALDELIQNPRLCLQLGNNARNIVNKYSISKIMDKWESVIFHTVQTDQEN